MDIIFVPNESSKYVFSNGIGFIMIRQLMSDLRPLNVGVKFSKKCRFLIFCLENYANFERPVRNFIEKTAGVLKNIIELFQKTLGNVPVINSFRFVILLMCSIWYFQHTNFEMIGRN